MPESFELGDESFGEPVGVGAAGEVVAAEVVVAGFAPALERLRQD